MNILTDDFAGLLLFGTTFKSLQILQHRPTLLRVVSV